MYGVPADLDLSSFVDEECTYVGLGPWSISIVFGNRGSINLECPYRIVDLSGEVVEDRDAGDNTKADTRLGALLNVKLRTFAVMSPREFALHFENGFVLAITEDDSPYESAQIEFREPARKMIVI